MASETRSDVKDEIITYIIICIPAAIIGARFIT